MTINLAIAIVLGIGSSVHLAMGHYPSAAIGGILCFLNLVVHASKKALQ